MQTIRFIQTAHREGDDRVTYHQMPTLRQAGYDVAWTEEKCDIAICDTPRAVLKAKRLGAKTIIYDVTEWYPSKKNLRDKGWTKPFWAVAMIILSWIAGCIADRFIFGERDKGKPFQRLFPWKKSVLLPYYPSREYIRERDARDISKVCRLFYAGPHTAEKGYPRVQEVLARCQQRCPETHFILDAINPATEYLPLPDFCQRVSEADIALDLRDRDRENRKCLPIKWFYYAAAGVPSVYSDLDAIRNQIPESNNASRLVRSTDEAVDAILEWVKSPELYHKNAQQARSAFEQHYHWEKIAERLLEICQ